VRNLKLAILLLFFVASPVVAEQYTAFSLKVAQQQIEQFGAAWRERAPAVLTLGGINRVDGFVYDSKGGDLILVGERDERRATLTSDDLVAALRARLHQGKWPLVSIDPTPETDRLKCRV
jgi:hypothetical protein